MKVLGLISGTSADGIDAALCEVEPDGAHLLAFECLPYSPDLRERILRAGANQADVQEVARLDFAIGETFAAAANVVFEKHGRAELIGSHGQTICHLPDEGVTLQIGQSAVIAERTQTPVVADFRPRDLACGGQGAPLVAFADWLLLRHATKDRVIQNIGGIANCTILPANCKLDEVRAWDTGPGNMVMDECAQALLGQPFDANGEVARRGKANSLLLENGMTHPFFTKRPPKTAGREEFGRDFAAPLLDSRLGAPDILATATALTARTIADSLRDFSGLGETFELIIGGGGAFNPTLLQMLQKELPRVTILRHEDVGIRSDAKEALAFAILAHRTWHGLPSNVPNATGAKQSAILGAITR